MKYCFFCIFLSLSFLISAQNEEQILINKLLSRISQTHKGEKLKYLDSLSQYIKYQEKYKYDSIVRVTLDLAIKLDSLQMAVNLAADLMNHQNNFIGNPDEGLKIYHQYLPLAQKLNNFKTLARFYINVGDSYYYKKNFSKAIEFYNKTIELEKITKEKRITGMAYWYAGIIYSETGEFVKASINYQEAAKIFEEIKDTTSILSTKISFSILYGQNGFYEEAQEVRDEAIKYAKIREQYDLVATNYFNAAIDAKAQNNQEKQLEYLLLALENSKLSNRSSFQSPAILSSLVIAYAKRNNLTIARAYFEELKTFENNTSNNYKDLHLRAIMHLTYAERDYEKALGYNLEYLNDHKNSRYEAKLDSEEFLYNTYEKLGDNKKALYHYKNYTRLKDSIINVQKAKALSYYQTVYETEKRDLKIEAQDKDIALLYEKDKVKNQYIIFSTIGLFTLFGFVLLVRSKNRAKEKKAIQEQFSQNLLQSQEDERNRIARDLHDSVGQQLTFIKKKSQHLKQDEIAGLANNALEEVRSISRGLYPATLQQLGLTASIEQLILDYDEDTNLFFTSDIDNIDNELQEEAKLNFYRFVQEILNNIVKHAQASAVSFVIEKHVKSINIVLSDNGIGFDTMEKLKQNSMGLKTIIERIRILNGKLKIKSKLNKGTTIIVQIPVHA